MVAIDGPAGSGKSTLALRLAAQLGLPYVNTGIMYRALARRALQTGTDPADGAALERLLDMIAFEMDHSRTPAFLLVGGAEPGPEFSTPEVEAIVSTVARHPEVRRSMAARQRELGREGAVMEGRDIGTVVFPDATVKIFLDASPDERAGRRILEREGELGVAEGLARRDLRDARVNPFVPARDAVVLDTTGIGPDEVFRRALRVVREALGGVR